MQTKHRIFLVAGLAAALVASTAISAPRTARGDAMLPPTAAELGLTKAHAKSWDALRADAVALRQLGRDDLQDGFGAFRNLLDQPSPDLRGFSEESQRKVDAHMAEARALRDRQLDLYESLSPDEKARVRAAMAQRIDRLSRLRERLAGFIAPKA